MGEPVEAAAQLNTSNPGVRQDALGERFWGFVSALAIPLGALAFGFPGAANRGRMLARALLGRFLVVPPKLHLAVDALALQLLLQRPERLVHIVVTNDDLHILAASDCLRAVIELPF
jgi:hypothetical protein